jgi:hypothetical protein
MIPLYGFFRGDTVGLLVLADEDDSIERLGARLRASARIRVGHRDGRFEVIYAGRRLDLHATVRSAGMTVFDRFDVLDESELST